MALHSVGKKGAGYFRYLGRTLASQYQDAIERPSAETAAEFVEGLLADYAAGKLASVEIVYSAFISPISTPPTTLRILPVEPPEGATRATSSPGQIARSVPRRISSAPSACA